MKRKKEFEEFADVVWRKLWEKKGMQFIFLTGTGRARRNLYFSFCSILTLGGIQFGRNPDGSFGSLFYNRDLKRFFFQMVRAEGATAFTLELTENHLNRLPEGILFYLTAAAKNRRNIFVVKDDIKAILEIDLKKYCEE